MAQTANCRVQVTKKMFWWLVKCSCCNYTRRPGSFDKAMKIADRHARRRWQEHENDGLGGVKE